MKIQGSIMSYQRANFLETDAMFLEFEDNLDNLAGGSSSVDDNAINGRIPMTITPRVEKPISPHVICFSQVICMRVRKTFLVRCLKWTDVGREYIERFFVFDFNDQAMNRFIEHQMLTTFKEFRANCHKRFKKYSNPEEARATPPNILEQSQTNKVVRQKQPYNHSSGSKSFLQRQHELTERKCESVDRVELFQETHVRAGTFVSHATKDVHKLASISFRNGTNAKSDTGMTQAQQGPPHDP
ncbi:CACTA en-spm transposon protein [Cucumis melo var. makuwa]|uniref:CACTA en-spm transposon protein n=1 Tax=Cucumis melo var. makuwa TaxID=1194695 RepID=A0A5A7V296_CUCMM|nr:CACTA en-spm transposon protein [Cucumis melo var. makuwa]